MNLNKPPGISSYDVIRSLKRLLPVVKLGHAGTLDPIATGVLICLVGEATRVAKFFESLDKEYRVEVELGVATDTLDRTGQILSQSPVPRLTPGQVEKALENLCGEQLQVPPAYSALKRKGRPAYELARKGIELELEPRLVRIYELELLNFSLPSLSLRVSVSKGTYIRSLIRDLAQSLGTTGIVVELERTRVGNFRIEEALNYSDLGFDQIQRHLIPIEEALSWLTECLLTPEGVKRVLHGKPLKPESLSSYPQCRAGEYLKLQDPEGKLLAIAQGFPDELRPIRLVYWDGDN